MGFCRSTEEGPVFQTWRQNYIEAETYMMYRGRGKSFPTPRSVGENRKKLNGELWKEVKDIKLSQIQKCLLSCDKQLAFSSKGTAIKVSQAGEHHNEMSLRRSLWPQWENPLVLDCMPEGSPGNVRRKNGVWARDSRDGEGCPENRTLQEELVMHWVWGERWTRVVADS